MLTLGTNRRPQRIVARLSEACELIKPGVQGKIGRARLGEACAASSLACRERQAAHDSERRATFTCHHSRTPLRGVRGVEPSVQGKKGLARLGEACDFHVSP
jgi:hypothetical protein